MPQDNTDIARRLRQTRADMLGTDDEQHYWDCHEGAAEIERLRAVIASGGDCPAPDNTAMRDNTPTPPSTPSKCTVPPWWTDSAVNSREDVGK